MDELTFKTVPFVKGGKTIGYHMKPQARTTERDRDVFEEIAEASGLHLPARTLESIFNSIISTAVELVEKDGRPRRIGNLKFMVSLKGRLESPYSEFDEATCKAAVIPSLMKGWEKELSARDMDIANVKVGKRVRMAPSSGTCGKGLWEKGVNLDISGENIQLIEGDEVTVSWKEGEEEKSAAVEVVSSNERLMTLKFPKELETVPEGTRILLKVKCRGGIVDGVWQTRYRKMSVVEKR